MLNNKRILHQKGIIDAVCRFCGEKVISICGSVKIHHWAYKIFCRISKSDLQYYNTNNILFEIHIFNISYIFIATPINII